MGHRKVNSSLKTIQILLRDLPKCARVRIELITHIDDCALNQVCILAPLTQLLNLACIAYYSG